LIPVPEIRVYKLTNKTDFIVLGCDGIFDVLSNTDVAHSIWSVVGMPCKDIHEQAGKCTDMIIRNCLGRDARDNLTCVVIVFDHFKNLIFDDFNNAIIENINYEIINKDIKILDDNCIGLMEEHYGLFTKGILPNVSRHNFTPSRNNNVTNNNMKKKKENNSIDFTNLPKLN
jgi:hypothetical protein